MTAASFNELFGIGPHAGNKAAQSRSAFWAFQENAANTTVADNDSTWGATCGVNTSTLAGSTSISWLPSAFTLDGSSSSHRVTISSFSGASSQDNYTWVGWVKYTGSGGGTLGRTFDIAGTYAMRQFVSTGDLYAQVATFGTQNATITSIIDSAWHFYAFRRDSSTQKVNLSIDAGTENVSSGTTSTVALTADLVYGNNSGGTRTLAGSLGPQSFFQRSLSAGELTNAAAGPELEYTSGASLDSAGNFSVGTWSIPSPFGGSNGTATYAVKAVTAAGATIATSTSATGTLDLSSNAGNTCYLLVQTSNNGGYDIGDYGSRTSGGGSANDGYYELASVVAAGGGVSVPKFYYHYQMQGAA